MEYPGNLALTPDVQQKILETFRQTLESAEKGNLEEARLGCDFILQLDAFFSPAQTLQERLEAASGAVAVDDLRRAAGLAPGADAPPPAATPPAAEPAPTEPPAVPAPDLSIPESAPVEEPEALDLFADEDLEELEEVPTLEDVDLELPPVEEVEPVAEGVTPVSEEVEPVLEEAEAGEPAPPGIEEQLRGLWTERRFDELLTLAQQHREALEAQPELLQLAASAQERLEAAPFVTDFLGRAEAALQDGDLDGARSSLEKAAALDEDHAGVLALRGRLEGEGGAPTPGPEEAADEPTEEEEAPEILADKGEAPQAVETDQRIIELLEEGQTAFDEGAYQDAIDAWSRIFLIDIDHAEASRRIELAREHKAERDRKIEEAFHEAIDQLKAGEVDAARTGFEKILELQPNHLAAKEHLEKIDRGEIEELTAAAEAAELESELVADLEEAAPGEEILKEEILVPPEPGQAEAQRAARAERAARIKAQRGMEPRKLFLMVGSAVLVAAMALGWFLYDRWDRLFPNAQPEVQAPAVTPISRATKIFEEGKKQIAIAQLKRIPPQTQYYEEAQALLEEWQAEEPPPPPAGPSQEDLARFRETVAEAQEAFQGEHFMKAADRFRVAARIQPLDSDLAQQAREAENRIEPLLPQIEALRQGEYELALPKLWMMREKEELPDIDRLLVTSYYNLGVRSLQRGDEKKAQEMFEEARKLDPEDPELERLLQFTITYQGRREDLLYRIYVKYLAQRPI